MPNQTDKTPTLLVVGGAGYIGSHTVHKLVQQDYRVIVLDNLVYGHRDAIIDDEVIFVEADLGDKAALDKLFGEYDIDAVMHFAAYIDVGESVRDPAKYYNNNVKATLTLLDAMLAHQCSMFIFSSTCAIHGEPQYMPLDENHPQNPINPYGSTKAMIERILDDYTRAYGLRQACLRYFNAAGADPEGRIGEDHYPETHLIPLVLAAAAGRREHISVFGTDYPTPDGTCIRDYVHVNDIARAHILAYQHLLNGNTILKCNLGTGNGYSVKQVIDAAEAVTGLSIPVVFGERRPGDPPELIANPNYAKQTLGWEAEYQDLIQIVQTAWNWMSGPKQGRF